MEWEFRRNIRSGSFGFSSDYMARGFPERASACPSSAKASSGCAEKWGWNRHREKDRGSGLNCRRHKPPPAKPTLPDCKEAKFRNFLKPLSRAAVGAGWHDDRHHRIARDAEKLSETASRVARTCDVAGKKVRTHRRLERKQRATRVVCLF